MREEPFRKVKDVPVPGVVPVGGTGGVIVPASRPEPMPNRKPPVVSSDFKLTPTFLMKLRLTSAKRTCRLTCSGVAVRRRLNTPIFNVAPGAEASTPGLSRAVTSRSAWALSSGDATVPVSTAIWPVVVTWMSASGIASFSMRSIEVMFWLTRIFAE